MVKAQPSPPHEPRPHHSGLRVLGCLLEKQRTTPDAYPLTLNALRAACNQSTNRDPVVDYDEATIRDALRPARPPALDAAGERPGSRAAKYRHLLDEALGLDRAEQAVLAVLMLRGPQTPGELQAAHRAAAPFAERGELHAVLDAARRARARRAAPAPARAEGGALRAPARRRGLVAVRPLRPGGRVVEHRAAPEPRRRAGADPAPDCRDERGLAPGGGGRGAARAGRGDAGGARDG